MNVPFVLGGGTQRAGTRPVTAGARRDGVPPTRFPAIPFDSLEAGEAYTSKVSATVAQGHFHPVIDEEAGDGLRVASDLRKGRA